MSPLSYRARHRLNWVAIAVVVAGVLVQRFTGYPYPTTLQLRITVVAFGTVAAMGFLIRGILTVFSQHGGWQAAFIPLTWAASMFLLVATELGAEKNPVAQTWLIFAAASFAVVGAVLQQRARERLER